MIFPEVLSKSNDLKEIVEFGEGVVGLIGIGNEVRKALEHRSLETKRDKLLVRIQGLTAARSELDHEAVDWQLREAKSEFAVVSQKLAKLLQKKRDVGFFRRLFLLYRPPNALAWIPQVLCWLYALAIVGYSAERWARWRNPGVVFGLCFYIGIFLLLRQWALDTQASEPLNSSDWPHKFWSLAPYIYGFLGMSCVIGIINGILSHDRTGWLAGIPCSVVMFGCAATVLVFAERENQNASVTVSTSKAILLLISPLALIAASVYSLVGNWRYWIREAWSDDPAASLFVIALVVLPLHAALSYIFRRNAATTPSVPTTSEV